MYCGLASIDLAYHGRLTSGRKVWSISAQDRKSGSMRLLAWNSDGMRCLARPTLQVVKVGFLEEGWVGEGTGGTDTISSQLIADVSTNTRSQYQHERIFTDNGKGNGSLRSAIAIANAGIFCLRRPILRLHFVGPFRNSIVGKCHVLCFPLLVVESGLCGCISPKFAMLPYRILRSSATRLLKCFGSGQSHATEVVQAQRHIPGISESVHDQEPILEETPDIREIEKYVAVRFVLWRLDNVRFDICDGGGRASGLAFMDCAFETAHIGWLGYFAVFRAVDELGRLLYFFCPLSFHDRFGRC
jgi:hypothetical protein